MRRGFSTSVLFIGVGKYYFCVSFRNTDKGGRPQPEIIPRPLSLELLWRLAGTSTLNYRILTCSDDCIYLARALIHVIKATREKLRDSRALLLCEQLRACAAGMRIELRKYLSRFVERTWMAKSSLFFLVFTSGIIVATVRGKNGYYCRFCRSRKFHEPVHIYKFIRLELN